MTIHSIIRVLWSNLYACEACRFRGYLQEAIVHVVKNQYVVPR